MKYTHFTLCVGKYIVAPYTGAWIEIEIKRATAEIKEVAPYTGAWIEIPSCR